MRRPSKKILLILAGAVVGLGLLCGGGWWYNASQATAAYNQQHSSYVAQSKSDLKGISDEFKALSQQGDSKKSLETLDKMHGVLNKLKDNTPALPQLFGVTLTPAEANQKRNVYLERIAQCASTVAAARNFMAYQQAVASTLQGVTTKTGANAERQKALADAWGIMIGELHKITPSSEVKEIHQQIVAASTAVHATLAALPDIYNKKDIPGFAAKQKEAEAHVNTLRSLGETIRLLAISHDKNIARDYAALNTAMQ